MILNSLQSKLDKFHTPSSKNVETLFKRFLGESKISECWAWQNANSTTVKKNLNDLIKRRGLAVHRGITLHPMSRQEPVIKRSAVIKALNLIYNLVDSTERKLGLEPTILPPPPPLP